MSTYEMNKKAMEKLEEIRKQYEKESEERLKKLREERKKNRKDWE